MVLLLNVELFFIFLLGCVFAVFLFGGAIYYYNYMYFSQGYPSRNFW